MSTAGVLARAAISWNFREVYFYGSRQYETEPKNNFFFTVAMQHNLWRMNYTFLWARNLKKCPDNDE